MSGIRETIKMNNLDINLKFALSSNDKFSGYQQDVDNLIKTTEWDLVNPVVDAEVRRFKYEPIILASNLTFYFYNRADRLHQNTFNAVGFSPDDVVKNGQKCLNSFFIIELYDTFNINTQTKILTTYMTRILDSKNGSTPRYEIHENTRNQFYYFHIPLNYLNMQTNNLFTGYVKFSFFNAINGKLLMFYNNDNVTLNSPEKLYFKVELNRTNATWKFLTTSFPEIPIYELLPSSTYVKKINKTVNNIRNKKQNYPTNNIFDSRSGTYFKAK